MRYDPLTDYEAANTPGRRALLGFEAAKTAFFRDPEGNRCQIIWRSRRLGQ